MGTKIGDKKLTKYYEKDEAIDEFTALYEEKTGNAWKNRKNFVKQPHKLYPLEIDYGEVGAYSKLPLAFAINCLKVALCPMCVGVIMLLLFAIGRVGKQNVERQFQVKVA